MALDWVDLIILHLTHLLAYSYFAQLLYHLFTAYSVIVQYHLLDILLLDILLLDIPL